MSIRYVLPIVSIVMMFLFPCLTNAAIQIPQGLNSLQREEALKILGFGMSEKIMTDPYPLGGYSGVEVGLSVETIPTQDLGRLGNKLESPQQNVTIPKLTIGKGLYNNVDIFFSFTPYNKQDEISQYGSLVRWTFLQPEKLPATVSVTTYFNSVNVSNKVKATSLGTDLIAGISVEDVSLFAGYGFLKSYGSFLGGNEGVTSSSDIETANVGGNHSLVGATIHMANVVITAQLDRYTQTVFSAKLALRF